MLDAFQSLQDELTTKKQAEVVQTSASASIYLFIWGFTFLYRYRYTVQVISRWVVGRAEETSTYSSLGFCTVNGQPTASN